MSKKNANPKSVADDGMITESKDEKGNIIYLYEAKRRGDGERQHLRRKDRREKSEEGGALDKVKNALGGLELPKLGMPKFGTPKLEPPSGFFSLMNAAIIGVIVLIIGAIGAWTFIPDGSNVDAEPGKRVKMKIRPGMDAREIGRALERENVIDSSLRFRLLTKLHGYGDQLKIGTYNFKTGMTYTEVFEKLLAGEQEYVQFTIPEGFTVKDIAKRLEKVGLANEDEFLDIAETFAPYSYVEKHSDTFYRCEGFLFPDTYTVESDVDPHTLLNMMAEDFDQRLTPSMRRRAADEGLSIYDLVTLASLVEKEVRYAEDRPIVAQVFFKRLALGMPLQTDASLQYLMDAPKEDVTIADTQIDSPYNTYQHFGLTPGPVANPGLDAIEAVLYPANTDYLYFVADRQGHNHYSYSYEEHLALVNQYR